MNAADAILDFIAPVLGPGWALQAEEWQEDKNDPEQRYAVLKSAGGGRAELLRTPTFTLSLIGRQPGDIQLTREAADKVVEAMRARSAAGVTFIQPGEPSHSPTADGRPVYELAVSAITT